MNPDTSEPLGEVTSFSFPNDVSVDQIYGRPRVGGGYRLFWFAKKSQEEEAVYWTVELNTLGKPLGEPIMLALPDDFFQDGSYGSLEPRETPGDELHFIYGSSSKKVARYELDGMSKGETQPIEPAAFAEEELWLAHAEAFPLLYWAKKSSVSEGYEIHAVDHEDSSVATKVLESEGREILEILDDVGGRRVFVMNRGSNRGIQFIDGETSEVLEALADVPSLSLPLRAEVLRTPDGGVVVVAQGGESAVCDSTFEILRFDPELEQIGSPIVVEPPEGVVCFMSFSAAIVGDILGISVAGDETGTQRARQYLIRFDLSK